MQAEDATTHSAEEAATVEALRSQIVPPKSVGSFIIQHVVDLSTPSESYSFGRMQIQGKLRTIS
jgi:hypothetical protein